MSDLKTWWDADLAQRYWLEITDRDDLGADLVAPQLDHADRPYWSYELVTQVRSGDVVLHWSKRGSENKAIVGWSIARGAPFESTLRWRSHVADVEIAEPNGPRPAWQIELEDYTALPFPVDLTEVRAREAELRRIKDDLASQHGDGLYFPFVFSDKRPVRTTQGYLVKFPAALLDVFPGLTDVPRQDLPPRGKPPTDPPQPVSGDTGYIADPMVRRAIEHHAVDLATARYMGQGYTVVDVGAIKSWDLECTRSDITRLVEVKGSTRIALTVELTHNEVQNALHHAPTDLFVVHGIDWSRQTDGSIETFGGEVVVYEDWTPEQDDLTATRFRYRLPTTAAER